VKRYYIHKGRGPVGKDFGYKGPRIRVDPFLFYAAKLFGIRTTLERKTLHARIASASAAGKISRYGARRFREKAKRNKELVERRLEAMDE